MCRHPSYNNPAQPSTRGECTRRRRAAAGERVRIFFMSFDAFHDFIVFRLVGAGLVILHQVRGIFLNRKTCAHFDVYYSLFDICRRLLLLRLSLFHHSFGNPQFGDHGRRTVVRVRCLSHVVFSWSDGWKRWQAFRFAKS